MQSRTEPTSKVAVQPHPPCRNRVNMIDLLLFFTGPKMPVLPGTTVSVDGERYVAPV